MVPIRRGGSASVTALRTRGHWLLGVSVSSINLQLFCKSQCKSCCIASTHRNLVQNQFIDASRQSRPFLVYSKELLSPLLSLSTKLLYSFGLMSNLHEVRHKTKVRNSSSCVPTTLPSLSRDKLSKFVQG